MRGRRLAGVEVADLLVGMQVQRDVAPDARLGQAQEVGVVQPVTLGVRSQLADPDHPAIQTARQLVQRGRPRLGLNHRKCCDAPGPAADDCQRLVVARHTAVVSAAVLAHQHHLVDPCGVHIRNHALCRGPTLDAPAGCIRCQHQPPEGLLLNEGVKLGRERWRGVVYVSINTHSVLGLDERPDRFRKPVRSTPASFALPAPRPRPDWIPPASRARC